MNTNAQVCIVDDDDAVRTGLLRLFRSEGIVTQAFRGAQEYLDWPLSQAPSCLVLDVNMPGITGLELHQMLSDLGRHEQVVFITGEGNIPMCANAMKAGAVDFLLKPFDDTQLLEAVFRALRRSQITHNEHLVREKAYQRVATLTPRELDVLHRVLAGMLNKEIADELGTAIQTVKHQRARLMHKMGVVSVPELVRSAQLAGILQTKLATIDSDVSDLHRTKVQ